MRNPASPGKPALGPSIALVAAVLPVAAHAYVGPGVGLTAIGTLVALVAALLLAVAGFVWYPIRRLMRRHRPDTEAMTKQDAAR